MREIEKQFSQDVEIMSIITHEPRLCTLHELQTVYSLKDMYDFLEIIEVQTAMTEERIKKAELERAMARREK